MKNSSRICRSLFENRPKAFVLLFLSFFFSTVINVYAVPTADFTASSLTVCVGQPVTFTNASTGNITSYSWNFGSGATPATANTIGPHSVTYSTTGQKTISLTVNGPDGQATVTKTNYISVGKDQIKFMSYNLLNYPDVDGGSITPDTTLRNPFFRTIVSSANPDILVIEELLSQTGLNGFLSNVMNANGNFYSAGTFINGFDTDNGILFKTSKFTFISNIPIQTDLRDISEFTLKHILSGDTIRIYAVHLKASAEPEDEAQRALEVDSLRKRTNSLPAGSNYIVCGDFNIYGSYESAYTKMLQVNANNEGHFIDPVNLSGVWNNPAYAIYHTQSPRIRAFGGGSTGGMDDRFDLILYSKSISLAGGMTYVPGSLTAYGNDGNHFNDSINQVPNTAVSQAVANALHNGSDHIPVMATFEFDNTGCAFADVGATALIAPTSPACSNAAQPLQVQVKNYGTNQENFATNNLQVVLDITNPSLVTTSYSQTVTTGSLNPGTFMTVSFTNTLNMSAAGNYIFNAHTVYSADTTTSNNSMPATTVSVVQNTAASITPGGATNFCSGGSVMLNADQSSGVTYQWKKNGTIISGATSQNYNANASGSYTVVLQKSSVVSTTFPAATFSNSNSYSIPDISCTGASSTINVTGYSGNVSTSGISVKINITHSFVGDLVVFLEAPNGDRLALANRVGGSGDNFTNTIFSDAGSTQIPASGAPFTGTYKPWTSIFTACVTNTKTTFATIGGGSYNPNGNWKLVAYDRFSSVAGTITNWQITFPSYNGTTNLVCDPVTSSPVTVTVNQPPSLSISPTTPSVCSGASVNITASGATTYTWTPATGLNTTTGSTVIANPSVATPYTVTGSDAIGCSNSLAFNVSINQNSSVTLNPFSNVCLNTPSFTLSGGQPSGGTYSGTGVTGGTTFNPSVAGAGTHLITYSYNNGGCSGNASSPITVNPLPSATITPPGPVSICLSSSVKLSVPSASTYAWSNGATTQSNTISSAGSYSVIVTDANGCTSSSAPVSVSLSGSQMTSTLFTETMGTVASGSISTHENNNRFDNDGFTMTGNADVRTTSASSGYTGASGLSNVFFTNTGVTNFIISGINTSGLSNIVLSFGVRKEAIAADGSDFIVQYSTNGSSYTTLPYTALPTGAGTVSWYLRTISSGIPASATLYLQFIQTGTTNQYRLDDVEIESTSPPAISASGATDFCQGSSVNLTSTSGSGYLWNNGATTQVVNVTSSGNFFVTVTGSSGCMASSNTIAVNARPLLYSINGGGSYCAGGSVTIGLSGSETTVNYQLKNGVTNVGSPIAGTGNPLTFNGITSAGTYTIVGTNPSAGCTATMTGSVSVSMNSTPTAFTVSGGGGYCAGGTGRTISLSNSQNGISYALMFNTNTNVIQVNGTGSSISFGTHSSAGNYSVVATNTTNGCTSNMSGSVNITINPNPSEQTLTGGGTYCANGSGVAVGLISSESGISYQLRADNFNTGSPVIGNSGSVSFGNQILAGNYTVMATNLSTTCSTLLSNSVNVGILPNPSIQNVIGGGSYCAIPGDGVPVGLSNSETGISYQLYLNNIATADPALSGTGLPLNFGNYTGVGNYTVIATDNSTSCSSTMNGSATVVRYEVSDWYHDADGDGYGNPAEVISDCSQPAGYISNNTDCNDALASVYPGAVEVCGNGIDDDCNNLTDENCSGSILNIKIFIEGFYLGSNTMQSVSDPVNNPSVCDTVVLQLANSVAPFSIFSTNKTVVNVNGEISIPVPIGAGSNSYYIVIKHRNALETWSSTSMQLNLPVNSYDFTNAQSKAYQNNLKDLGDGNFALFSGDVNHDGSITVADLVLIENSTQDFVSGYLDSDLSGDDITESSDYSLVENNIWVLLKRP